MSSGISQGAPRGAAAVRGGLLAVRRRCACITDTSRTNVFNSCAWRSEATRDGRSRGPRSARARRGVVRSRQRVRSLASSRAGHRINRLRSGPRSEYGRYVRPLRGPAAGDFKLRRWPCSALIGGPMGASAVRRCKVPTRGRAWAMGPRGGVRQRAAVALRASATRGRAATARRGPVTDRRACRPQPAPGLGCQPPKGSSGGARAGSFRHSRIFRATVGSSMAAMRRSVDPQRGHRRALISKKHWTEHPLLV